jgi:phosphoserine phosphatase
VGVVRLPITKGIAGEAARLRQMLNIADCYADPRFNPEVDRRTGYRTRSMLTIPLVSFDGQLEGVAQVLNKHESRGGVFGPGDEAVARALAVQAGIALRRAKSIAAEIRRNKIEADLLIARKIQQASWPKALPEVPGYDIAAGADPADETGGDAFDMFVPGAAPAAWGLDAPQEGHRAIGAPCPRSLMFALGDATGHGIGPALSVAQFRAMFRMGARLGARLRETAAHCNSQLGDDLPTGRFITAFFGRLDPDAHQIEWVSMGQAPVLVVRPGDAPGTGWEIDASGMPLGVDADSAADVVEPIGMNPGDVFVLLSDGYYEAMNPANQHFGTRRVLEVVGANRGASAGEILAALRKATLEFADGRPFDDDQTAIIIKRR